VTAYIFALRASIDHALATTYRRNPYDGKSAYVGHISLVKGVPFFGYSVGYKVFLKVYMLNPFHMTRFADLLHQGAIMNRVFQPYESHLQYILQWMCDYNLYGCDYIDCAKVLFRGPVPDSDEIDVSTHKWHDASIPEECMAEEDQHPRQSHCTLEVDICVQDILNRHELQYRPIHHDFLERSSQMPRSPDDKYVPSMAGLWRDETRRRKLRMGLSDPSSSPFPAEVLVSMSADPRNNNRGGWIHEEEYRELVGRLIDEEKRGRGKVNYESFVKPIEGQAELRTAVDSIEDLYPGNLLSQSLSSEDTQHSIVEQPQGTPLDNLEQQHNEAVVEAQVTDEADAEAVSDTEEQQSLDPLTVSLLQGSGDRDTADELIDEGINLVDPSEDGIPDASNESDDTRKRSLELSSQESSKRQRIMAATQGSTKRVSFRNMVGARDHQGLVDDGAPRPGQSSQASIKAQGLGGPTTLAFPVVKYPNAPETVLRLSQSGYSNSQETPKTPGPKRLTVSTSQQSPITPWTHQKTSPMLPSISSPKAQTEAVSVTKQLGLSFKHRNPTVYFGFLPPSAEVVETTMMHAGLPPVIYGGAHYSQEKDVPARAREYAGREFKLQSTTLPFLPPFDPTGKSSANIGEHPPVMLDKSGRIDAIYDTGRYRSHRPRIKR
jgi:DNA polymerase zeta